MAIKLNRVTWRVDTGERELTGDSRKVVKVERDTYESVHFAKSRLAWSGEWCGGKEMRIWCCSGSRSALSTRGMAIGFIVSLALAVWLDTRSRAKNAYWERGCRRKERRREFADWVLSLHFWVCRLPKGESESELTQATPALVNLGHTLLVVLVTAGGITSTVGYPSLVTAALISMNNKREWH